MRKNIICLCALISLIMALTACGNETQPAETITGSAGSETEAVVEVVEDTAEETIPEEPTAEELIAAAQLAYDSGDYAAVEDTLEGVEEAAAEELRQLATAQMQYADEDYTGVLETAESCEAVKAEECYTESAKVVFSEAINAAASERDAELAVGLVEEYIDVIGEDYIGDEIGTSFSELIESNDYSAFEFMDAVMYGTMDYEMCKDLYQQVSDAGTKRTKAFLLGTWIRIDCTTNTGLIMEIKSSENTMAGIITSISYAPNTTYSVGDVKWKNIEIFDATTFMFDDASSTELLSASAAIDYYYQTINVHVKGEAATYFYGAEQTWMKLDYLQSFTASRKLSDEDFDCRIYDSDTEACENVNYKSMIIDNNWYFTSYRYNPDSEVKPEDQLFLSRGIAFGATKREVYEKFGVGRTRAFSKETDPVYVANSDESNFSHVEDSEKRKRICELMVSTVKYCVVYYDTEYACALALYFDRNDEFCWLVAAEADCYLHDWQEALYW